jgi:hypothetical protein
MSSESLAVPISRAPTVECAGARRSPHQSRITLAEEG